MNLSRKDKASYEQFKLFAKMVQSATIEQAFETDKEKEARIANLLANPIAFFKYYFPHYCTSDFASFHKRFFKAIIKDERCFVVRQWARAHGKSVGTVLLAIYLALKGDAKAILWVSRTFDNAAELLQPIQIELENNQRIIADFGTQMRHGSWEDGKFVTSGGVSFRAIGMGQSPRGTRNQESRPDLIFCDDVDSDDVVRNPKRLDDYWEWIMTALYACFDIKGAARFVLVNNRIAKDCLSQRASKVAGADFEKINILNSKSEPSWSERFTKEQCQQMIDRLGYRFSQKEYFNNPLTTGTVFKEEHIRYGRTKPLSQYSVLAMYTDPSFKHSAKSDFKASAFVGLYEDEWHIIKCFCDRVSVQTMWQWHYEVFELCDKAGASVHMAMEANFMQGLHFDELDKLAKESYPLPVKGDKRKKPDKFQRIESMSPYFDRGKIMFNNKEQNNPHQQRAIEQLLLIEKGSRSPDDFPDALESAIWYARQKLQLTNNPITMGKSTNTQKRY